MLGLGLGGLLMLIGAIWMIVIAIKTETTTGSKAIWAILIFFFSPIAGLIYYLMKKVGLVPLILIWIGVLLYGYGFLTSAGEIMKQMK